MGSNHRPPSYSEQALKLSASKTFDMSGALVGGEGIEPSTSFLSGKRSTSELTTRILKSTCHQEGALPLSHRSPQIQNFYMSKSLPHQESILPRKLRSNIRGQPVN